MKKISLLIAISISFCTAYSQIVLEHEYTNTDFENFAVILLDNNVSEYIAASDDNKTVNFYNLDNSLNNTIVIDTADLGLSSNASLHIFTIYTTDKLFDNDDGIEIPAIYSWWDSANSTDNSVFFVFDDDGSILLSVTQCWVRFDGKPDGFISNTTDGTKMYLNQGGNTLVYSLLGNLPCKICPDATNGKNDIKQNTSSLSNAYPNPTSDYTRIDYQLPDKENRGEITIFDMNGIEVKKYQVDKTFNHLKISTQDLSAGTYFYNLKTPSGISAGKKMIVVK